MNLTKKDCIMTISSLPDIFIQQFYKIACYYKGYMAAKEPLADRSSYIIGSNNALMMLNNLITTASNGIPVDLQICTDSKKIVESLSNALNFLSQRCSDIDISVDNNVAEFENLPQGIIIEEKPKKKKRSSPKKGKKTDDKN